MKVKNDAAAEEMAKFEPSWQKVMAKKLFGKSTDLYRTYKYEFKHHAMYKGNRHGQGRKPQYKDHSWVSTQEVCDSCFGDCDGCNP